MDYNTHTPTPVERAQPMPGQTRPVQLRQFPGTRSWDTSNPWIYIGSLQGTRKAKQKTGSLICPLDIDPAAFSWPVTDMSIMVVTDDDKTEQAVRLAQILIRDGAQLVVCCARGGWYSAHRALTAAAELS